MIRSTAVANLQVAPHAPDGRCGPVPGVGDAMASLRRALRRWLAAAVLFLVPLKVTYSADYYACDCADGSAAQCIAGDDTAPGTSAASPWRSHERARSAFASLDPGDSIRFCRGGVFPIAGASRWVNTSCRADAPCIVEAYAPPWGNGEEPRPRLRRSGDGHGFALDDTGNAEHEEGYVLRDLDLVCTACDDGDYGVFFYNDIDDVRLERLSVRGFGIGVYVAGSNPCTVGAPGCDRNNARVTLIHSEIRDNLFHGFLGAGDDMLIADNRFERNGSEAILEHNIYLTGLAARAQVLRNTLYRSAALLTGRCRGTSLVAHGWLDDLRIEDNLIYEDLGAADPSCWGIELSPASGNPERFLRAVVRGNTVLNVGTAAIAIGVCVDCVVENNVIVHEQPHAIIAIRAPVGSTGTGDAAHSALTVRNNSIYVATSNSVGIGVGGQGEGHVVVSNAIQSAAGSGFWACLSLDLPFENHAAVDHNVCSFVAGAQREWELGSGALVAWRAASGFDSDSVQEAPGFAAAPGPDFDLSAISASAPMIGRGHPLLSAPVDVAGLARGSEPDAGAFQRRESTAIFSDGFEPEGEN